MCYDVDCVSPRLIHGSCTLYWLESTHQIYCLCTIRETWPPAHSWIHCRCTIGKTWRLRRLYCHVSMRGERAALSEHAHYIGGIKSSSAPLRNERMEKSMRFECSQGHFSALVVRWAHAPLCRDSTVSAMWLHIYCAITCIVSVLCLTYSVTASKNLPSKSHRQHVTTLQCNHAGRARSALPAWLLYRKVL